MSARKHNRTHVLPREMQEVWKRAQQALTNAFDSPEPLPLAPYYGHYIKGADKFLSARLAEAPEKEATAQFAYSQDGLVVEVSWWVEGKA
jgi:hypothetical protein